MSWPLVKMSETYLGLYDGPHGTPRPSDKGRVFLGIGNITDDGHLDLSNARRIADDQFAQWTKRVTPQPRDIVFTYEATLNRYAIVPDGFDGCLGRRVALIRPNPDVADYRFLFYSFFSREWRETIERNRLSGATVDRVPLTLFPNFPIRLPSLPTQRRIAEILSTYDDLIENNTRRIAILEDMARRLFEAWFLADAKAGRWVDLETLSEGKTGIQTGPFGSQLHKQDYSDDGVPVVMPKNMADLKIREEGIARIPSELAATMPRHILRDGDIVYGRRGDIGRRAFVTHREDGWFCGTGCLRIRPDKSKISPRYLFDALGLPETDGAIKGRAHGATMPNLSAGLMKSVPVFLPEKDVQERYAGLVDPLFELAASLEACTTNLRATRDLLLPKLICGEIEVRTAEEELEAAAA